MFNLQKYLIENNLTLRSIVAIKEEEEKEPSKKDMKDTEKDMRKLDAQKKELADLKAKAKDIIFKYTVDTPQGRKVKGSIADYKKAIGDIPQKIKNLEKKIKSIEEPSSDSQDSED